MVDLEAQANAEGAVEDDPSPDVPARLPDETKDETSSGIGSGIQPEPSGEGGVSQQNTHDDPTAKRSINSYYPARVGILQTVSLILNAGLMLYAHLGLSAVILSSQDPTLTTRPALVEERDPPLSDPNDDTSAVIAAGRCTAQADLEALETSGGFEGRPETSNYCSREYEHTGGTGCLLDADCIQTCFREEYGYSEDCSVCFSDIPQCSVNSGCTFAW